MGFMNQLTEFGSENFSSGSDSLPATATSIFRSRRDAATSRPIKLQPITTARFAPFAFSMIRLLSASVRKPAEIELDIRNIAVIMFFK
jgi:hypothetical protein